MGKAKQDILRGTGSVHAGLDFLRPFLRTWSMPAGPPGPPDQGRPQARWAGRIQAARTAGAASCRGGLAPPARLSMCSASSTWLPAMHPRHPHPHTPLSPPERQLRQVGPHADLARQQVGAQALHHLAVLPQDFEHGAAAGEARRFGSRLRGRVGVMQRPPRIALLCPAPSRSAPALTSARTSPRRPR